MAARIGGTFVRMCRHREDHGLRISRCKRCGIIRCLQRDAVPSRWATAHARLHSTTAAAPWLPGIVQVRRWWLSINTNILCTSVLLTLPTGLEFSNLQPGDLEAVVRNHIVDGPPEGPAQHAGSVTELRGLHLFVCSHGVRMLLVKIRDPQQGVSVLSMVQLRAVGNASRT